MRARARIWLGAVFIGCAANNVPAAPPSAMPDESAQQPEGSPAPLGAQGPDSCTRDDECVVTDFPGCCDCCSCSTPYATRKDALAEDKDRCAVVECAGDCSEECPACPREALGSAVCRDNVCVRVKS